MFKKEEHKKRKRLLPFVIFRLLLSLSMFIILALGSYQAFKYFSGIDPIKMDPKTTLVSFLTSEGIAKTISGVLGFNLSKDILPEQLTKELPLGRSQEDNGIPNRNSKFVFRFALVADSHNDNEKLRKALSLAKKEGVKFVIGLGDYSDVGTLAELQKAKDIFISSDLPFYLTAGDHDLWDARDKGLSASSNFNQIFGSTYQTFSDSNIRFVIIYNSDNYDGVDALQQSWLKDVLKKVDTDAAKQVFVFMHEPLYHPSSDRVMGSPHKTGITSQQAGEVTNTEVKKQAEELVTMLQEVQVTEVFTGDVHFFSRYQDPKSSLKMTTVGALTEARNTQKPRFAIVDIYEDGSYNVRDIEVN